MLVILRRGGSHLPSHVGHATDYQLSWMGHWGRDKLHAICYISGRGTRPQRGELCQAPGHQARWGVAVVGPSPGPGSPMGHSGKSVGVHGQGRGPGRSVSATAPHKARRVGELRESDEGSLLLLPFRCAAAQLGKASASG